MDSKANFREESLRDSITAAACLTYGEALVVGLVTRRVTLSKFCRYP